MLTPTHHCSADIEEGAPRERVNNHMRDIAIKWAGMTKEEKESDELKAHAKKLEDNKENKEIGCHHGHKNASLAAFHSSRLTVDSCKDAVSLQHPFFSLSDASLVCSLPA